MGRESTNVSYAKPLWNYAIVVYSENKAEFLRYQDLQQLCVNDLIVLSFCYANGLLPTKRWWANECTSNLREIIIRLRNLRNQPTYAHLRQDILMIELACEKIDLERIADQLRSGSDWSALFADYCNAHLISERHSFEQFIKALNNKKGAKAP